MKKRLFLLLVGLGLANCGPEAPRPTSPFPARLQGSSDSTPAGCKLTDSEGPGFTQNKRLCYEGLAAIGRYQDVIDRIELKTLAPTAQEKFFLGSAYFGLSHRTGAHSLQCFYTVRARQMLEEFLQEQQGLFRSQHSFGTTDDMKYVDLAAKTLDELKSTTGCEESSHTVASLEHYGRAYAIDRLQGLFYKTEAKDSLRERFQEKLGQLNDEMRNFVSAASQVETRYGTALTELDSGRQYLLAIKDRINGQFKPEAVQAQPNKIGGDDSFPSFSYNPALLDQEFQELDRKTEHFKALLDPNKQGEIALIEADIRKAAGADSMDGYAARKEKQVAEVQQLSARLLLPTNFWSEFLSPEHKGVSQLQAAIARPAQNGLFQQASSVDALWAQSMKGFCNPARPAWYCKNGGTP